MSLISAQIDELRNAAEFYDGFKAADLMREAADTIWQLRDDLQRANAAVQDAEHDESMAWDRVRKAEAENAKLRKYVAWLEKWALDHASIGLSAEVQFELDMARRELGIEVDG